MPGLPSAAPRNSSAAPNRTGRAAKPRLAALPLLLLAVGLLLLAVVAGPVFGQTTNTDYDMDDNGLIEVSNAAQLSAIRHDLNGNGDATHNDYATAFPMRDTGAGNWMGCPSGTCTGYELTGNITLTGNWTPIATTGSGYTGTLDGGGYSISGLQMTITSGYAGLFQRIDSGAVIRDLGLISPTITSSASNGFIGGLAGRTNAGSVIHSSYVQGGTFSLGTGLMEAGGLVGHHRGALRASWSTVTLQNTTPCSNCNSIHAGGLVGQLRGGSITASYAAAVNSVAAATGGRLGGLAGQVRGVSPDPVPSITNSYCNSSVMVVSACVGGHHTGTSTSITATALTTTLLQAPTAYTGIYAHWNIDLDADTFVDFPWTFGSSSQYPTLRTPTQRAASPTDQVVGDYDLDDDGLIEIRNQLQLAAITHDLNGDGDTAVTAYGTAYPSRLNTNSNRMGCPSGTCTGYELGGDLTLTGSWTPLGTYTATLDGGGHSISGLSVSLSTNSNTGLFALLGGTSVVRDLGFSSPSITSTNTGGNRHGVLAGSILAGGVVSAVYVSGGTVTSSGNNANTAAGGLVGLNRGTIRASWANATVATAGNPANGNVGGLVGDLEGGSIIASYAYGTVTPGTGASINDGLLVGRSMNLSTTTPTITNSYCVAASGDCIGSSVSGSGAVSSARQTVSDMQTPTDYSGIFLNWNIDLGTDGDLDYPWDFRTSTQYPILNTPAERAALIPSATDYDADDDGLIDISTQAQLHAMRWDLNGDGAPETANYSAYGTTFAGRTHTATATTGVMGCPLPASGGCTGYELTGDLALTGNWTPIGPSSTITYNTTFDGQGHTISGLTVSVSADAGLFGRVGGSGVVRNVGIISPSVTSSQIGTGAAGLVGYLVTGGVIETSYVDGGTVTLGNGLISAGGLVGYVHGAVRASWSTATLQRTSPCNNCNSVNVGGLAGRLIEGSITASYAAGPNNASGGSGAILGGLVGRVTGNSPTITNSYCDSTVMVVTNCIGGYAVPAAAATASAAAQSTSELQTPTGYTGIYSHWNLDLASPTDNVPDYLWNFGTNSEYPTLNSLTQRAALLAAITPVDYDADDDGLIDISTAAQLHAIRWDANGDGDPATADAHAYSTIFTGRTHTADSMTGRMGCPVTGGCTGYELTADLTLTGNWTPMDFTRTFDGRGHTISGLTVSVSSGAAGLFGALTTANGVIRNVGLLAPSITNSSATQNAGGLVGSIGTGANVDTSYVADGSVTVSGATSRAGGLAGTNSGRIRASYATAAVGTTGDPLTVSVGGMAGWNAAGEIVASYAAAVITVGSGSAAVGGGLVGTSEGAAATITDSYCDSTVRLVANCIGASISSSTAAAAAHPTTDLQSPTAYAGTIYANWNLDLDGDSNTNDDPWDFGTASQYPALKFDTDGNGTATAYEFGVQGRSAQPSVDPNPQPGGGGNGGSGNGGSSPQPVARGGGQPYHPASAHPEIYTNPRHEMAVSCQLKTTGEGEDAKTTSTLTFDLGSYTRPITLVLSLWDGQFFRTLQSQNIPMPELRQEGQTATVEVVTDPSQTRFRIDSEYGLNLVLGYADCRTDDPE